MIRRIWLFIRALSPLIKKTLVILIKCRIHGWVVRLHFIVSFDVPIRILWFLIFSGFSRQNWYMGCSLKIQMYISTDNGILVHCCTIFHLRSGLWNIVQGGEAIYGVADCKWGHRGKSWPNWVPFFSKTPLTQCSGWPKKISPTISTQIST